MARTKAQVTVRVEAVMEPKPAPATFSKSHILTFKRYANRRDLLTQLLKDGENYTLDQVDGLIQNFMKKDKVK